MWKASVSSVCGRYTSCGATAAGCIRAARIMAAVPATRRGKWLRRSALVIAAVAALAVIYAGYWEQLLGGLDVASGLAGRTFSGVTAVSPTPVEEAGLGAGASAADAEVEEGAEGPEEAAPGVGSGRYRPSPTTHFEVLFNPRCLSCMASYDVARNNFQALVGGRGRHRRRSSQIACRCV